MRGLTLSLALGVSLCLAACGKQQAAAPPTAVSTPPATALVPAADAPAAPGVVAGDAPSAPAKALASKVTRTNEDGSETVENTSGDSGSHNPLLAAVASTLGTTSGTAVAATTAGPTLWQEGKNYTRLVPAQPTSVAAGQVEVLEFFWYACPHCYAIDPLVESWKKSKAAYITFLRVPVMWNEGHRSLARLYYTLETLGKLDQAHGEVFKEIQVTGNPLLGTDPSNASQAETVQATYVKKFGISDDAFRKAYHSFAVETALQRADQMVQRYRVDGVPTFVINGKYVADVRTADGPERLMSLVSDLAAQEHKP